MRRSSVKPLMFTERTLLYTAPSPRGIFLEVCSLCTSERPLFKMFEESLPEGEQRDRCCVVVASARNGLL